MTFEKYLFSLKDIQHTARYSTIQELKRLT